MDAVAARFADGIEMVHRRLAVLVDVDAAHEVVLGRRDRDPVLRRIDAVFQAAFINVREMMLNDVFAEDGHVEPDEGAVVLLHLLADFGRHQIAGQDFVGKTLTVFAAQLGPFTAD